MMIKHIDHWWIHVPYDAKEPSERVPSQNQAIIKYRHLNTLTWQNVAVILAWGMWEHAHWTVWNELIEDSTIKKLYQSINNTEYHIATLPTKPLSHVWQYHYEATQPCPLPNAACVKMRDSYKTRFIHAEHWLISLQVEETHWCLEGY